MTDINKLITDNIDVWSSAIEKRNPNGRGSSSKIKLVGINKLRNLILELAVRGRLVSQNEKDEEVSKLLQKINLQRNLLISEKKIKQHKVLPEITIDVQPFDIPDSWSYQRFGDVMFNRDGERKPVSASERKGMQGKYDYYGASGVIDQVNDYLFDKTLLLIGEDGANLLSRTTPIAFLAHGKYWVNNHAHVLDGIHTDFLEFVALHINAISLEDYITGTAQPKMNQAKMNSIVLAIPPEEEQKRIIAKVSELMALCDQLEQQTEVSIHAHQLLVEELLSTLISSENAQEFEHNWARFADHFDLLFTTEHSIEQLKQTILQLGAMGKLVPQNSNDEPASKLLERIVQEKEQLIKDKVIKKQKSLPVIKDCEKAFSLPKGWEWERFGNVYELVYGDNLPKPKRTESGEFNVYGSNGVVGTHNEACVKSPCIVIGRKGSAGALNKSEQKGCWVTDVAYSLSPFASMNLDFIFYQLHTCGLDNLGKGIKPGLNRNEAYELCIAIPPIEEQQRIVNKIVKLFELCDSIKNLISEAQNTQLRLATTIVNSALGRSSFIKLEEKKERKAMKISTELSLGSVAYDKSAILAPIIGESGGDAKSIWYKCGLTLPDFYKQLKSEIASGFVSKPAKAEFVG